MTLATLERTAALDLPEIERIDAADPAVFYGADQIAAAYCGLRRPPGRMRGIWQHGWAPAHWQFHPAMVASELGMAEEGDWLWVARSDEAAYLQRCGYPSRAIGLPIVYLPEQTIPRRPSSLLVMPAHSLEYTTHTWRFDEYAEEIAAIRSEFAEVVVCAHQSCWRHGYWIDAFRERGFPVVQGAGHDDRNSLERIRRLLSTFEYVTTNAFGSHIAYAAYLGARVSVFGTYAQSHAEDFSNDPFFRHNPHLLEPALAASAEETLRRLYPEWFCHPRAAGTRVEWGRRELGAENRVSPAELRRLFGWSTRDLPVRRARAVAEALRRAVPEPAKHLARLALRPSYRRRHQELARLAHLPCQTPTSTDLLGPPFELVDGPSFVNLYRRWFVEQIGRFNTTAEAPRIIDMGAGVGVAVLYYKRLYPKSRVLAFERDPAMFAVLERNCQCFGLDGVELVRGEPGGAGSLEAEDASRRGGGLLLHAETCRLRDALGETIDLLKLSLTGTRVELLRDCADQLANVRRVLIEFGSVPAQPQELDTVLQILTRADFRLHLHAPVPAEQPFMGRDVRSGFDLQLTIFAFRG